MSAPTVTIPDPHSLNPTYPDPLTENDRVSVVLHTSQAAVPTHGSSGAAGYDLYASENVSIPPHSRALVSTDISIVVPEYHYGRIAPRSGLGVKGIDVGAGVVDSDYRGIIKVLLINHTDKPFEVTGPSGSHSDYKPGMRIAQFIFERISTPSFHIYHSMDEFKKNSNESNTERGSGGFGSTGV